MACQNSHQLAACRARKAKPTAIVIRSQRRRPFSSSPLAAETALWTVKEAERMTMVESQRERGRGGKGGGGHAPLCVRWNWKRMARKATMEAAKRMERETRRRMMPMLPA